MCRPVPTHLFRTMLALVLCLFLLPVPHAASESSAAGSLSETVAQEDATSSEDSAEEDASPKPARGYILMTLSSGAYWLPLPEEEDYTFPIRQVREDGTEELNLLHVTPEGFYMESSTCENQDCVEQGLVTLENRSERILGGWVICLPNLVYLELYTPEEILALYMSSDAETGNSAIGEE